MNFPLELTLNDRVHGPGAEHAIYDCIGVSEHMGGLGGGHYTACCRLDYNDVPSTSAAWFRFNDASVSRISTDDVVTEDAYILFYVRRGAALRWGGLQPSWPIKAAADNEATKECAISGQDATATYLQGQVRSACFGFKRGFLDRKRIKAA